MILCGSWAYRPCEGPISDPILDPDRVPLVDQGLAVIEWKCRVQGAGLIRVMCIKSGPIWVNIIRCGAQISDETVRGGD
jgi:hypothetical protein